MLVERVYTRRLFITSELFIDLTKDRFTDKNGKVRTIDQKVADLVGLCPKK